MSQPSMHDAIGEVVDLPEPARSRERSGSGVTAVLESMVRNTEAREHTFAKALRDQVAHAEGAAVAGPGIDRAVSVDTTDGAETMIAAGTRRSTDCAEPVHKPGPRA